MDQNSVLVNNDMPKPDISCCDWLRSKLLSLSRIAKIGDAKEWATSALLQDFQGDIIGKTDEVIGVIPDHGEFGHVFWARKIEGRFVSGYQFSGEVIPIRVERDKVVLRIAPQTQEAELVEKSVDTVEKPKVEIVSEEASTKIKVKTSTKKKTTSKVKT